MSDMENLMILCSVAAEVPELDLDPIAYIECDSSSDFIEPVKETSSADAEFKNCKDLKSIPKGEAEETDEKNNPVSLDTDLEAIESTDDIVDTIKLGDLDHTYARNLDKLSNAIRPVRVTRGRKKRQQNCDILLTEFNLVKHMEADFQAIGPVVIRTPPFPFVFTPLPLEAVCNVEVHSNGDPVFVQPSTRPVLESVENRVACKSLSEQKYPILPDDSAENLENVEESIDPTALKMKPFQCKICNKAFTRRFSLKYHMMIHNNQNRFHCQACGRLFRHPTLYKEHLRTHTEIKI